MSSGLLAASLWVLVAAPAAAQGLEAQGPEFQVNSYTLGSQALPSVAADVLGDFVVVWTGQGSGTDPNSGIQGQRYASNGVALGGEFQVNSYTTGTQSEPSVASDAAGDFVVVWVSAGSYGSDSSSYSIQGQRYASSGIAQGSEFQVNSYTTNSQAFPAVAAAADGDFLVVWHSDGSAGGDTSGRSIQGQRYASNGSAEGPQFQVNSYTTGAQYTPAVAAQPNGDFVVVWWSDGSFGSDTSGSSIQGRRYASNGTALGGEFQVNTVTTSDQGDPSVAADAAGDFAVVWGSALGIEGQRYTSNGTMVGGEFQVNTYVTGTQGIPRVVSHAAGDFVVVWETEISTGIPQHPFNASIRGQYFSSSGTPHGGELQVSNFTTSGQGFPAVAAVTEGGFVVMWHSRRSAGSDHSDYSIQGQRYASNTLGDQFQVNTYTSSYQRSPAAASDAVGDFVVVWESNGSSGGDTSYESIQGQRYDSGGSAVGSQFQVNSYTLYNQSRPSVASDVVGDFVVVWEGASVIDPSGGIRGQRYTSTGSTAGGEFQVNSYTTNGQYTPAVATESNGDFVVVWTSLGSSGGDTSNQSVQGQRYASSGTPVGSQFQVNSSTIGYQRNPSVASDADGDFVVVWESYGDGSFWGIWGQRYASSGTRLGSEFQVNGYTTGFQVYPSVAANAVGDFVVVWQSDGSFGSDRSSRSIQGQRYTSNGAPLSGQFQVNTYTSGNQVLPSVTTDPLGTFVVTWQSNGSFGTDTDNDSIQGQRYLSNGTPIGGEFQVDDFTTSVQRSPSVVADATGHFVVVWESNGSPGTDSSSYSIQGQRYLPEPTSTLGLVAGIALLVGLRGRDVTRMRRRTRPR